MRGEEAVLFVIVTVLSFALVAAVVAPLVRRKRTAGTPVSRPFAGFAIPGLEGPRCPACRRGLLPGFRFCPFDGTPLVAETARTPPGLSAINDPPTGSVPKKICPRCARAYRQDTAVCAHDGIPLVPVN
jgi:hypothetical protein